MEKNSLAFPAGEGHRNHFEIGKYWGSLYYSFYFSECLEISTIIKTMVEHENKRKGVKKEEKENNNQSTGLQGPPSRATN